MGTVSQEKWRNDLNPEDEPTVSFVVTCATDTIKHESIYELVIRHVNSFPYGKGFMASVRCEGRSMRNGRVHHGTNEAAYAAALNEGETMLREAVAELECDTERYK